MITSYTDIFWKYFSYSMGILLHDMADINDVMLDGVSYNICLMKTLLKVITWVGVGIFAFGASLSFWTSWVIVMDPHSIGVGWGHMFGLLFGVLGLVFMLIGGLLSKPRYFWLVSIIVGLLYIVSFFSIYQEIPSRIRDGQIDALLSDLAISLLPGLVAIAESIWIKVSAK